MATEHHQSSPAYQSGKQKRLEASLKLFEHLPDCALIEEDVLCALTGWSRATVWREIGEGRLPRPIKLGPRSNRWRVGTARSIIHTGDK